MVAGRKACDPEQQMGLGKHKSDEENHLEEASFKYFLRFVLHILSIFKFKNLLN
mgnify:CR=1 FL=1